MIPGTYPALEQELDDLNAGLDTNSKGDHKQWLPRVLLDFIEVSFLHFELGTHIGPPTEHSICGHRLFNNSSHLD